MLKIPACLVLCACQSALPQAPQGAGELVETTAVVEVDLQGERAELVRSVWRGIERAQGDEVAEYRLRHDNGEGSIGFAPRGVSIERLIRPSGGKPASGRDGDGCIFQERKYNRQGQILAVSRWGIFGGADDPDFEYRHEFQRSAGGRLERVETDRVKPSRFDEEPEPGLDRSWKQYIYDDRGELVEQLFGEPGDRLEDRERIRYSRDDHGALERIDYLHLWILGRPDRLNYACIFGMGEAPDRLVLVDAKGSEELLAEIAVGGDGTYRDLLMHFEGRVIRLGTERLDAQGQVAQAWRFDSRGELEAVRFERAAGGRTHDSMWMNQGQSDSVWPRSVRWDKAGRIVSGTSNVSQNGVHSEYSFRYEDDEHGNWIRRGATGAYFERSGTVIREVAVITRELIYFD